MPDPSRIPTLVLGATGYVAGEALRLLSMHPVFDVEAAIARSSTGERVDAVFPHLAGAIGDLTLHGWDEVERRLDGEGTLAVVSALPHAASARLLDELLTNAATRGRPLALVDLSADFRLQDVDLWEQTYGESHPARERCAEFTCALPDLERAPPPGPVAHPGCFTTAVTLGCAPLAAAGLADPATFRVSAVTGSTGSGRDPKPATHHPVRHGNLRGYGALRHRHVPEMEQLLARTSGDSARVLFVPHSGPFARGIHATIHVTLREAMSAEDLATHANEFYAHTPFVTASAQPPALKDVVGTNRCRLGFAAEGRDAVIFSVIDNLTKGAAGGAVQWLNRMCGLADDTGLGLPAVGWS